MLRRDIMVGRGRTGFATLVHNWVWLNLGIIPYQGCPHWVWFYSDRKDILTKMLFSTFHWHQLIPSRNYKDHIYQHTEICKCVVYKSLGILVTSSWMLYGPVCAPRVSGGCLVSQQVIKTHLSLIFHRDCSWWWRWRSLVTGNHFSCHHIQTPAPLHLLPLTQPLLPFSVAATRRNEFESHHFAKNFQINVKFCKPRQPYYK